MKKTRQPGDPTPIRAMRGATPAPDNTLFEAATRLAELDAAAADVQQPAWLRRACLALRAHYACFERWVDADIIGARAPIGVLSRVLLVVEPREIEAGAALRRYLGHRATRADLLAAFALARRGFVTVMSTHRIIDSHPPVASRSSRPAATQTTD